MDELRVEDVIVANDRLSEVYAGNEPGAWAVVRGDEVLSVHMTEAEAKLMLDGDTVKQRFLDWAANRRKINEREEAGEFIGSDDWAWSDDDAVETMQMMAELLGWK
jgi:hypothetical protein